MAKQEKDFYPFCGILPGCFETLEPAALGTSRRLL